MAGNDIYKEVDFGIKVKVNVEATGLKVMKFRIPN